MGGGDMMRGGGFDMVGRGGDAWGDRGGWAGGMINNGYRQVRTGHCTLERSERSDLR